MPKKRLTMRQIRELLRLKYGDSKQSDRAIARNRTHPRFRPVRLERGWSGVRFRAWPQRAGL
jgi:hypothetical protein